MYFLYIGWSEQELTPLSHNQSLQVINETFYLLVHSPLSLFVIALAMKENHYQIHTSTHITSICPCSIRRKAVPLVESHDAVREGTT